MLRSRSAIQSAVAEAAIEAERRRRGIGRGLTVLAVALVLLGLLVVGARI